MRRQGMLKRFLRDEKASVGMIFGLTIIPLMGLTGASVDYARASMVRLDLQSAVDATALALAKDAVTMTPAQVNARAQAVFEGNWNNRFGSNLLALTVARTTDRFTVEARVKLDNVIMQIVGLPSIEIATNGVSGWGVNKIEIALVLDNTGSMGWSNKMQELKKALCGDTTCSTTTPTTGFIRTMRDSAIENDQIRISLVPFDTTVRVPQNVQNAVTAGTDLASTFSYSGAGYCGSNPTTAQRVSWTWGGAPGTSWFRFAERDKDTISSDRNAANVFVGRGCGVGRIARATWQGCLWDRDQTGNRDTAPTGVDPSDIETLYPAVTCRSNNLARMMPLTDVRTNMSDLILALRSMQPSGNTNLTIGATWGTNMLTPGLPMSTAATPDPERPLRRFMILLTDGDNTENRQTGNQNDINARARLACTAAKAQGITVYSVRVIEGNRNLLQECASGPGFYYEVSNASQLAPVFQSIAGQIGAIRLTN